MARVLKEAGYELEEVPTRPYPDKVRRFERAKPNQLWQTDLFTFVLKRQNRRVYLMTFMDDHSRFLTGFGLHASQSTAQVLEVLAGMRTPSEAAQALSVSVPRYYALEQRAVASLVAGCEPGSLSGSTQMGNIGQTMRPFSSAK